MPLTSYNKYSLYIYFAYTLDILNICSPYTLLILSLP